MSFLKFLFGKKDKKTNEKKNTATPEVIENATDEAAPNAAEPIEVPIAEKAEAPLEAKPKKKVAKKSAPVEKPAIAEDTLKEEDPVSEMATEEMTTEEIDAAFSNEETTEVSLEIAQAEAKSGRALARFEIKKSKDNRFVFNLYAPNRVIVATSQIYSSSPSAVNGIKSIMVNAPKAPVEDTTLKTFSPLGFPKWEIYTDKGGQFRFRLYAPNGSCIVHSQGYTTKASCKNGIASIVKNAPDAIIDKSYLKKAEN